MALADALSVPRPCSSTSTQGGVGADDLHVGPLFLGPDVLVGDDLRPHRLRRAGSR
jgi:hypothetical protein